MIGRMIHAFGVDDVDLAGAKSRKLRFQMIANSQCHPVPESVGKIPLNGVLSHLPTASFTTDPFEYNVRAGRFLLQVLTLEAGWPSWPAEIEEDPTPASVADPSVG